MENPPTELIESKNTITAEKAQLIVNSLPDSLVLISKDLRIIAFNACAAEAIKQLLQKEILPGMSVLEFVPESRQQTFVATVRKVLAGKTYTTRNQPAPQEVYENDFYPFRNEAGSIVGVLMRSVNITQRQKAERAIQEAEERWQFAFEASHQAAWEWNMKTDEVIYSSSYKKMYGFLGDELQNDVWEWKSRIHPEDRGRMEQAVQEHANSDNPYYETTYRIQLKNGEYKWIMARGKLLEKDTNGSPLRMIGTHTDLTQTLRDKAEIREMNERFHYAAKASLQALWEWNAQTGEAYVSPSFTEMFGWSIDENKRFEQWHQYVHPDERKTIVDGYYSTLEQTADNVWQGSYRFLKADGSYAHVNDRAYILRDEQNKVIKVIGATQDITALKKAEEELVKSNERYDILVKATNELIWEWDFKTGEVYRKHEGIQKVYGITDASLIETVDQWMERIHPEDRENITRVLHAIEKDEKRQTFDVEYRFRREDGHYNHIEGRGILLRNDDGEPVRMIGSEQDVSERKRLERELLQNELEMKKRINQATVDSQEQERSEIGRELHDNVNQVLTTTRLYLELAQGNTEMREELLNKSCENIAKVIAEIRQLSRSLMDPAIGDLGIVDAINDLVENLTLTGKIQINLAIEDEVEMILNKAQKLTVFRIIQESLNNVIKHASATFVTISLVFENDDVLLEIEDDGIGFSPDSVKKGSGLKNITNRVYLINGNFDLDSRPGHGCTITIKFPITKTI